MVRITKKRNYADSITFFRGKTTQLQKGRIDHGKIHRQVTAHSLPGYSRRHYDEGHAITFLPQGELLDVILLSKMKAMVGP